MIRDVAVVFDCNIYITCASLTGVPFGFRRLLALKAKDQDENLRRLALLRGYTGGITGVSYHVYWSDHILAEVVRHLHDDLYWSFGETDSFRETIQRRLIDLTGGRLLHGIGEGYGDAPDHEDGVVYETCLDLVRTDPMTPVLLVTDDHGLIHDVRANLNGIRGGAARYVLPMTPAAFIQAGA
ncbi:hypothetical protein [Bifidobacterium sp. SO1]|uniref:hypothetical protein n=1 Tax=Bifidobacterium sp. SO1 TaxID=2809029 RepID=UPI001BDD9137|nr:hypothetical protein [Bifidobacterium sp. SO1]MBT1162916.1 hypothetical protein [Bifidobacterium sp. SO1]